MKIAYFDCIAGASGDMLLGALLDAGFPETALQEGLLNLGMGGFEVSTTRLLKNGLSAIKVNVDVLEDVPTRSLVEIERILTNSKLQNPIIAKANHIFRKLAGVEAKIHHNSVDEVHLHELGGIDTVVDVVGVLLGIDYLEIQQVYSSPLPMTRGFVNSAHGPLPLPAPATLALLEGTPVYGIDLDTELVTPTGAVLLKSLVNEFKPIPSMILHKTGYGAGQRDLPIPNLIRVLIGSQTPRTTPYTETLSVLETNIDDQNPEIYDYTFTRLFAAGALDVYLSPIQMKKNRPATLLSVLCRAEDVAALTEVLFAETSTLGIRQHNVSRLALPRQIQTVATPYGSIRVKVARWGNDRIKTAPEFDDCRRIAAQHKLPLREVYRIAEEMVRASEIDSCE